MKRREPVVGSHWLLKDKVYKVTQVSRGTDEILLEDINDGQIYRVRYGTFQYGYERVLRVGEVAQLLKRHPRSLYRYERQGLIGKPITYPQKGARDVRFYTKQQVIEIHEMISQLHQGRPRKDKRVVNNTTIDIGTLKIELRERYG